PEDIASSVVFLASDNASSISGTVLTIDCGLSVRPGW
ncbi:MAG: SDR family oxidoreductase, partial [Pseudomonadales bacterium]|nr:SDR family oxidoreductase [Pseudomonadales bacterium]